MAKYSNEDGVWRTIKGRHIFIKKGQSINDALKESENYKKNKSKQSNEDEERMSLIKSIHSYIDELGHNKDDYNELIESAELEQLKNMNDNLKWQKNIKDEGQDNYLRRRMGEKLYENFGDEKTNKLQNKANDISDKLREQRLQNANEEGRKQRDAINKALADIHNEENARKRFAEKYDTIIHDDGYVETIPKRTNNGNKKENNNPREEVKNYLQKGEFNKAREAMKDYGLEDEEEEFISNLSDNARLDYKASKKGYSIANNGNKKENNYKTLSDDFVVNNKINTDSDDYTKSLNKYMTEHGELGGKQGGFLVYNSDENDFYKAKLEHDKEYVNKQYPQLMRNGITYNVVEHIDGEGYHNEISATGKKIVMKNTERYRIENPNDKSDWGWISKEEYEGLMSKQPILNNQIEDMYAKFIRKGWMAKDEDKINDTYHLGNEKKGYYIQFQDYPYHEGTLDLSEHRRTSPKNDVRTWARVWRDGENIYNKERQHKMQARADVAKFLEGEKSYSTLVQSYMKAGFTKAQAEAFAKYQLRRRK